VGFELGGFLIVIAAVAAFRHGRMVTVVLAAAVGVLLAVLTIVRARVMVLIAQGWMTLAAMMSRVTSPVLLTVVYLVVFTPMAWMRRIFGRSPIARAPDSATYWAPRERRTLDDARRAMERQF
jgi:fatty acid desaturase